MSTGLAIPIKSSYTCIVQMFNYNSLSEFNYFELISNKTITILLNCFEQLSPFLDRVIVNNSFKWYKQSKIQ